MRGCVAAGASRYPAAMGRALALRAVCLHLRGRVDEAAATANECPERCGSAHTCGCGDLKTTMAEAFRSFDSARLPTDLLSNVDVAIADADFLVQIALRREPTPDDIERLNDVIHSAHAELRRGITTG
jgi:hypothetical protein